MFCCFACQSYIEAANEAANSHDNNVNIFKRKMMDLAMHSIRDERLQGTSNAIKGLLPALKIGQIWFSQIFLVERETTNISYLL